MTIKTVVVAVLLLFMGQGAYAQKSGEKRVRKAFESYKVAILNDKGEEAIRYVDSRTIKHYSYILELIKTADSTKVETLSLLDKLMVLSVRHRTPKEDVLRFDGEELLIFAIESGMVAKSSVQSNSIGEVTIDEQFAKGQFLASGQPTPLSLHFYEENGNWKVDLTSLFPFAELAFNKMIEESGEDQNEYLFSLLEIVTGSKPDPNIWKPVI